MSDSLQTSLLGHTFLAGAVRDGTRPTIDGVLRSIKKSVDMWDWRTIVLISRKLYANMGVPRGAINLKAMLSVGEAWDPVYQGPDVEWAKEAKRWLLEDFYPMCNVRGPLFDFKTDRYLDSVALDRCGDIAYLLTASDSGFPMVQAVPNHLITTPHGVRNGQSAKITLKVPRHLTGEAGTVDDGPVERTLTAATIQNGVAYNLQGRAFAYCVFEEAAEGREAALRYKWVHEQYLVHVFDPEWYEQGRGFPAFTHAVREFISMLTSQEFEEITHMIMSSISLEEHNEEGASDATDPTAAIGSKTLKENLEDVADGEIPEVVIERIVGGVVRYFKSNTGGKIVTPARTSPGPVWDAFQDRLIRVALAGTNMPYSIVWKGNEDNGTSNRVSIEKVHRVVLDRQSLLSYPALRIVQYALAKAMNTGRLKRSENWYQWTFSLPPEFRIDDGRMAKSDRDDYVLGHQNLTGILARQGRTLIPHLEERAEEEAQKQLAAKRVTEKYASEGIEVTSDMLGTSKTGPAASTPGEPSDPEETPPKPTTTPSEEEND